MEGGVFRHTVFLCHHVSSNFSYDMSAKAYMFSKMANLINNVICKRRSKIMQLITSKKFLRISK